MLQAMKLISFTQVGKINPIKLDPATHVMVLISLKIVMKQCASDVNLNAISICHLNALGNATPTDNLAKILLTTVTMLTDTKKSIYQTKHTTFSFDQQTRPNG